jgi:DNA processing protein
MVYSENALNILAAKTYRGIGKAWIIKNIKGNENVDFIVALLNKDAKEDFDITVADFERNKAEFQSAINKLEDYIDGVAAIGDKNFPAYRGKVKNSDQPILLFYRGDLSLLQLNNKNIAVIGLLNPDVETEIIEQELVYHLVKNGATIVSGLALGCDSIAHRQALVVDGKTVAILPGPLNKIMPAANKGLADEIVEKRGLLISEYFIEAKSKMELNSRYQERDRLQALFSDCIILAASYAKNDQGNDSGSRLAMEYALNYCIPRAVIYDSTMNLNDPKYDLNRQLIREQKGITIINRDNLTSSAKSLISILPNVASSSSFQHNLFD